MVDRGSQENQVYCQNVRAIENLVAILCTLSFPPSPIMHHDKIKSHMVYSINQSIQEELFLTKIDLLVKNKG